MPRSARTTTAAASVAVRGAALDADLATARESGRAAMARCCCRDNPFRRDRIRSAVCARTPQRSADAMLSQHRALPFAIAAGATCYVTVAFAQWRVPRILVDQVRSARIWLDGGKKPAAASRFDP
jgi:hypothetical protein